MPDATTGLFLFGFGAFCGYILFQHDERSDSTPFYEENLVAMVGATVGGGILFTLPYLAFSK
jgi:formate/nitrite transporter FocA (FNT family)